MVIGTREAKSLFGQGDSLYLRLAPTADVKVGDQFTLFRPTTPVYHPVTRDYMGQMVVILGVLEIARESGEGVAEARIVLAFDSMAPGDILKPYATPPPVPAQQVTSGPLSGLVLDFKTPRQLTGQSEILYLDRGEADGVALGDRFSVSHRGKRLSAMSRNPDHPVAQIKIISLQARTATASVLHSSDAIRRGDILNRLPPPPPKAEPAAAPPKEATSDAMAVAKAAPSPAKPVAPPTPAVKTFEDVYFDSGKSTLTDQAKKTLAEHADYLKQNPALAITIEGYADDRGSAPAGLAMGEKRAQAVRRFLADLGVKNTLTVTSFGKDKPVCTEKTAACHAKNRRVHLAAGN
jgi:outer membrane protein OmpA-like peptidoglycan-associated protein